MTPEELNRTIEFIIQSQARLAAAQEQDRQDRIKFEEWSKGLSVRTDERLTKMDERLTRTDERLAGLFERQTELLDHQSRRMDRLDQFYEESLRETRDFNRQALHLLNLGLDRLPPAAGQ